MVSFINGRIIDCDGERTAPLHVAGGRIVAEPLAAATIDLAGAIMLPGFVEVHTHGGGGHSLHSSDPAEIRAYAAWAPNTGVTAFLAGVVGVPGGLPEAQIAAVVAAAQTPDPGAEILGIHLEGPYISPLRRGAHPLTWLRAPDAAETMHLLEIADPWLRIVTLAPELPGAPEMIARLVSAGINVSIGHTDATYEQARAVIPLGIRHATHCFNAMRPLLHREPGPLGAIVEAEDVLGELIADGVHVHPAALRILLRALGPARTVIVTDALACAGLRAGTFSFAGQPAQVIDGAARLADGTLTGSVLTMDVALRNLVEQLGQELPAASTMLSYNPARAAGVGARKGRLRPGYDADLLILDSDLQLQATYCRGALAYRSAAWRHG
ncbi:MAG: N-acetylglucosamine-6-phosphate deacetylase [Oscillochloris sp.]|nr:N-acetylglucosamine-6-phosphate deacetylase [Oscillochloris sp.]